MATITRWRALTLIACARVTAEPAHPHNAFTLPPYAGAALDKQCNAFTDTASGDVMNKLHMLVLAGAMLGLSAHLSLINIRRCRRRG